MEVIEDGNIMDRIPILLQRDFEYYQKNQTVLSETICCGVVGGRLDFPRNASFAAVKIVLWLEEEFLIAFRHGSGMFVALEDEPVEAGVAKTSDPDKFVQLAIKSSEMLLEHLHVLTQEALDHADLSVLTATLGAAALLKNSLHCYVQLLDDSGSAERHSLLQASYKHYVTMSEAVAERVLDLHNRVLSLYILQDSGGRPIDDPTGKGLEQGSPSVQGWWLYMQGSKKDLWDTVPPRMAQRIFAGMLNETLTILNVRYCQTVTTDAATPLLLNDILNILLCVAQLLPSICGSGADLCGLDVKLQTRDVRDVHAKCNELFMCLVYRGADLHYIHQAFTNQEEDVDPKEQIPRETMSPWFTFVSPHLFDGINEEEIESTHQLPTKTAIGLELIVLLAQPQPSWPLLVKILMMRNCQLSRLLVSQTSRVVSRGAWAAAGRWFGARGKCAGFLCTADGYCTFKGDENESEESSRVLGALTFVLASVGSKAEFKSALVAALELSGKDWADCLDKRQVWCDKRPSWLAGILGMVGTALQFIPPILVNAVQSGASMYQTMSLCLACLSRTLACIPTSFSNAASVIEKSLPAHVKPVGRSVLLQMLITITYEELLIWSKKECEREKAAAAESNGEIISKTNSKPKQVKFMSQGQTTTSSSISFDATHSSRSSIAIAIAEALCYIDEDDKHTQEIQQLVSKSREPFALSNQFGLEDFPEFAGFLQEGTVPGSNAERSSDAAVLTTQILMTAPGRDSLRVIYNYIRAHSESLLQQLSIQELPGCAEAVPLIEAPLLYIMFHIGRRPFDQYLRGEWPMPWSSLVRRAKSLSGASGARVHVARRNDFRKQSGEHMVKELNDVFKSATKNVLS